VAAEATTDNVDFSDSRNLITKMAAEEREEEQEVGDENPKKV
jgi:hypothetical protein